MQEGVVQMLYVGTGQVKTPLLAAVGPLQFEVVQYRLQAEYQAESHLESREVDADPVVAEGWGGGGRRNGCRRS